MEKQIVLIFCLFNTLAEALGKQVFDCWNQQQPCKKQPADVTEYKRIWF